MSSREPRVEIDLDALDHNLDVVTGRVEPARLIAVVKANAYGHGATEVAARLSARGVSWFAVARLAEAVLLRARGIEGRILVLDPTDPSDRAALEQHTLTPLLSSYRAVERWCRQDEKETGRRGAQAASPLAVHLKIDSGLHRLGIEPGELSRCAALVAEAQGLRLEAVCSHFSASEDLDGEATAREELCFERAVAQLAHEDEEPPFLHLANSAAALHWPTTRRDLVRCGGALYGLDLSVLAGEATFSPLRPVMRVVAPVVQTRWIEKGDSVGYGGRFVAARRSRLAVLCVGYADGYASVLSSRAHVLFEGGAATVVGAVSMDRMVVDVTELEAVEVGEQAVLLGTMGASRITAQQLAVWSSSATYEVTTRFGARLPREVDPR